jgi:5-methylcytosine-specific restriction enzyme subunit McrC
MAPVRRRHPRPRRSRAIVAEPVAFDALRDLAEPEPTVRVVSLTEYGEVAIPLSLVMRDGAFDFFAEAAAGGDVFQLRFRGRDVVLKAGRYVGQVAVNQRLIIEVAPRLSVPNLDRILRLSGHIPREAATLRRSYAISPEPFPSLLDTITRSFLAALRPLHTEGLYRRYERRQEATSYPRGRFLFGPTITRHRGRGHTNRAEVSYFELMRDNGPNRALKLALWRLAALVRGRGPVRGWVQLLSDLNQATWLFEDVRLDTTASFMGDIDVRFPERIPAHRRYYVPALELARLVIEGRGVRFGLPGTDVTLPSLLIDLQEAFESYLRAMLPTRLDAIGYGFRVLDGNAKPPVGAMKTLFDTPQVPLAQPDIVIAGPDGSRLVAEVKYINRDFAREEINQALAYALSYRAPCVLIRPRRPGDESGLAPLGTVAGVSLYRFHFDLGGDLEPEEGRLARELVDLWTAGGQRRPDPQ